MLLICVAALLCISTAQSTNFTQVVLDNIGTLQSQWYNPHASLYPWNGNEFWNDANTLEAMTYTGLLTWPDVSYIFPQILANQPTSYIVGDGSNDDNLWFGLACKGVYQLTGGVEYLERAVFFYDVVAPYWDTTTCGGGIWWSSAKNYKNAVTNELFLMASIMLHTLNANSTAGYDFLQLAQLEVEWFLQSGMINSEYLINDGLTSTCQNNGQTEWTYNQGVILGGLLGMYSLTQNYTYIDVAIKLANASTNLLVYPNGVLKESCEPSNCDQDQYQFKGVYARYLGYLTTSGVLPAQYTAKFSAFLNLQAESNLNNNIFWNQSYPYYGLVWEGPYTTPSSPPTAQSSVLDSLNAALSLTIF